MTGYYPLGYEPSEEHSKHMSVHIRAVCKNLAKEYLTYFLDNTSEIQKVGIDTRNVMLSSLMTFFANEIVRIVKDIPKKHQENVLKEIFSRVVKTTNEALGEING